MTMLLDELIFNITAGILISLWILIQVLAWAAGPQ